jgi:protease-4
MPASPIFEPDPAAKSAAPTVVVQTQSSTWRSWTVRLLGLALGLSLLFNLGLFAAFRDYFANVEAPVERFHSGDEMAKDKIVILKMDGTIMPPYTERLLKQIRHLEEKATNVKGVLLLVDSPGGYVGDSDEIYHHLRKLSKKHKIFVHMKGMAASGGYYISMGAGPEGKIFAEPTTWTGSIGVIIPRYDVSQLAEKIGVGVDPLKTGEFKDALSPFRPLTESERKVWEDILNQAFDQFLAVIDSNRENLSADQVKALATGQIYTAKDALESGLIDEIAYEDETLEKLKQHLGVTKVRVVTYEHQQTLSDILLSAQSKAPRDPARTLLESSVPRALYYCSWLPPLPE